MLFAPADLHFDFAGQHEQQLLALVMAHDAPAPLRLARSHGERAQCSVVPQPGHQRQLVCRISGDGAFPAGNRLGLIRGSFSEEELDCGAKRLGDARADSMEGAQMPRLTLDR